jgi:AcrR family transcriptional regulator
MTENRKSCPDSERTELRRQQVLDAAAECFHRSGFHGASMAQIAKSADMSPGHIYNLFENKNDIIGMIVEREQAERLAKVDAIQREDDVVQAMIDQVEGGIEDHVTGPKAALRLEVLAEAGRNAELAAVVRNADAAGREKLAALMRVALAQANTQLAPHDLCARVEVLMALFDGLMVRGVRNPDLDREAVTSVVRRLVKVLLEV